MTGNVWEWCLDEYKMRTSTLGHRGRIRYPVPTVPTVSIGLIIISQVLIQSRVLRGGSWLLFPEYLRGRFNRDWGFTTGLGHAQ